MYKKNQLFFLILSLLLIFFLTIKAKEFRIDASSDTLVAQNDEDYMYFNYYNNIFPSQNYLILAIKSDNKINEKLIKNIDQISNKIIDLDKVYNVFNINKAPILFANNTELIDLSNQKIETIENSELDLNVILNEFSDSPIYKNQIINHEQNVTSIIIYLKDNFELNEAKKNYKNKDILKNEYLKIKNQHNKNRKELIKKIRYIISQADSDYDYFLGGIDMITDDVISFVKKDILVFSITAIIIITFVLIIIFKEIKWVLICLFTSFYSVLSMFGILGLTKIEVTAVSANFSSLMFILSISMNIHIINHYRNYEQGGFDNIIKTIKIMIWPCLYTVLTTIVAFASLLISDIKPIIDFGYIMIIALLILLIASFTILPLLISLFPNTNNSKKLNFKIINFFNYISINHSFKIMIIAISLFMISIYGITKLNVENSFINYFKKNTEIYQGMKIIDSELGGTTPLDLIITFDDLLIDNLPNENESETDNLILEDEILIDDMFEKSEDNNSWFTNEKIKTIKKIHEYLENHNEIGKVQSVSTLIEMVNLLNKKNLSIFELSVLYDEIPENYKKDLIYPYLSIENNMARITARVRDSEKIKRKELVDKIDKYMISEHQNNLKEYKINGLLVLYNNMLQSLFSSQIKSLSFVIIAIFLMFLILFKSVKLSIIGIIPNIFASGYILGIIGILNIPLDIMTTTIAAITIGIAVDNTIHYLYRYKENYKINNSMKKSINLTHSTVGFAVFTTSLTIALGFSVLCLSNFVPTVLFGVFTSLAMIIAMLGVLILLPSLLFKKK